MNKSRIPPSRNPDLLKRLKEGNEEAWAKLIEFYTRPLFNYIRSQVQSTEDAKDIIGETFAAAVLEVRNFQGPELPAALLFSVARRKINEFYATGDRSVPLTPDLAVRDSTDARLTLQEALETLPETSRKALLLRYQEGLSVIEVAEELGASYKEIETLISQARRQLQAHLLMAGQQSLSAPITEQMRHHPAVKRVLAPVVRSLVEQQKKCELHGRDAEAAIFRRCAAKLENLLQT